MPPEPSEASGSLSVVVPVYNEAANFPALLAAVEKDMPRPFTLSVVYDFDEDTTVPVAREAQKTRPWLRLVKNTIGRGAANALRAGFNSVERGPVLVMMADLSDDLGCLPRALELYRDGCRVVCPSRYMKGGQQIGGPWLKRFLSRMAGLSLHWFARLPTHDATNNFRLYDAELVRRLGVESTGGFEVAIELTAKAHRAGVKIAEVPTTWRDRTAGESRFKLMKWLPKYLKWWWFALFGKVAPAAAPAPAPTAR
ncbi:MAG TPA: glycosyltransferase [Planctomycetota bacterium]|nr:glycosyltransferase [Planctomycetota bacterium]